LVWPKNLKFAMNNNCPVLVSAVMLVLNLFPARALSPGDIAFIGYNGDGDDNLAFVALAPIPGGTDIFLSDNEWNGNPVGAGGSFLDSAESEIKWTAPVGGVPAGTVVLIDGIEVAAPPLTTSLGAVEYTLSSNLGVGASGEAFFAFVGSSQAPTNFLSVIISGATTFGGNLTGTGLTLGDTGISVTPGTPDVMAYTGPRSGLASFAAYLPYIHSATNWITEDGTGNQNTNGIPPEVPFDPTPFTISPSAPTLTIAPATPGNATISWTPATAGFVLQETLSLAPTNWVNSLSGATNPVVVPATVSAKFYRVFKP
jgi:hypothetical protein